MLQSKTQTFKPLDFKECVEEIRSELKEGIQKPAQISQNQNNQPVKRDAIWSRIED